MKICSKCKIEKDFSDFSKNKTRKDWFQHICKECANIEYLHYSRTREWLIYWIYRSQKKTSKRRNYNLPNYSSEELKVWIFNQPNFEELYNNWATSWYKKDLIPSIDRKNDYKPYSFNNIQLMTWIENRKKAYLDMKEWRNNKQSKVIIWVNINTWEEIIFHSIRNASRFVEISRTWISECCSWQRITAWGYKWRYYEDVLKNWQSALED